jgi:hypothetical protein
VNVSAVVFKDNSNITLISMSVYELPKSQTWRYDRKKKDQVEISRPATVSVYSSHIQNFDLLNRNRGRFLTEMQKKNNNNNLEFSITLVDTTVISAWVLYRQVCAK